MNTIKKIIIAVSLVAVFPLIAYAQNSGLWYLTGGNLVPDVSSWGVKIPSSKLFDGQGNKYVTSTSGGTASATGTEGSIQGTDGSGGFVFYPFLKYNSSTQTLNIPSGTINFGGGNSDARLVVSSSLNTTYETIEGGPGQTSMIVRVTNTSYVNSAIYIPVATVGSGYFFIDARDGNGTMQFNVDGAGDVVANGTLNAVQKITQNTTPVALVLGSLTGGDCLRASTTIANQSIEDAGSPCGTISSSSPWTTSDMAIINGGSAIQGADLVTYTVAGGLSVSTGTTISGKLSQSGGLVALASTSITGTLSASGVFSGNGITNNGNATTTSLAVRNATSGLLVTNSNGAVSAYGGSTCTNQAATGISATGTVTGCTTYLTGNQTITITLTGDSTGTASGATSISIPTHVSSIQGVSVDASAPTNGDTAQYNGTQWTHNSSATVASSLSGQYTGTSGGKIVASSTLASSSWGGFSIYQNLGFSIPFKNRSNVKRNLTYFGCDDDHGTSTISLDKAVNNVTTTYIFITTLICGANGNSTTTFSTSTINPGEYLIVTSTAVGTPSSTNAYLDSTKQ